MCLASLTAETYDAAELDSKLSQLTLLKVDLSDSNHSKKGYYLQKIEGITYILNRDRKKLN